MLFEYIERARQKTREARKRLVWTWSIALTGVIVLVWLSVLFGRQYAEQGGSVTADVQTEPQKQTSLRSLFDDANTFLRSQQPTVFSTESYTEEFADALEKVSEVSETEDSIDATSTRDGGEMATPTPELWP